MNFKKIITVLLVMALTATAAVGGTLAYLTDRDSEANVFTVGDVSIELNEEFEHASTLIPGVDIEKDVKVTNLGPNDAWVWVTVAIPKALDGGQDPSKNVVHFNYPEEAAEDWTWLMTESNEWVIGSYTDENGIEYAVYTTLYNEPLSAGEQTDTSAMHKVYMDKHVDIDPDGNMAWVDNGTATDLGWNINEEGNPVIFVSAYAIQAEGFTTAKDAYEAYQKQWGDNGAEYGNPIPADAIFITNDVELVDATSAGGYGILGNDIETATAFPSKDDVTLNLNGKTIDALKINSYISGALDGDKLTITGDGTIKAGKAFYVSGSGSAVTINGGTYQFGEISGMEHIYVQNSSILTINDGTFISTDENAAIAYCINGFIEINGGFFQNTANPKAALLNMGNNLNYVNNQKITLRGGTFVNWNPMTSAFAQEWPQCPALIVLADGYKISSETQANGDVWYTVVPA